MCQWSRCPSLRTFAGIVGLPFVARIVTVVPDARSAAIYEELFPIYRRLYFGMGRKDAEVIEIGGVLPALRRIAAQAREAF